MHEEMAVEQPCGTPMAGRMHAARWGRHDGTALLTTECQQPMQPTGPRDGKGIRTRQLLPLPVWSETRYEQTAAAALPLPLALFSFSSTNGSDVPTGRSAGGRSSQLRMKGWFGGLVC